MMKPIIKNTTRGVKATAKLYGIERPKLSDIAMNPENIKGLTIALTRPDICLKPMYCVTLEGGAI